MIFMLGIAAFVTLNEGIDRLDRHPAPPSAYALLAIGGICLVGAIVDYLFGGSLDD